MRVVITSIPEDGIEIYRMKPKLCLVRMFKNPEEAKINGKAVITADVVEVQMYWHKEILVEVQDNLEKYFSVAKNIELGK